MLFACAHAIKYLMSFKTTNSQRRRPQEPQAVFQEPQDTSTNEELSKPLGEIIAQKTSKKKGSAAQQKRTVAQARLEDKPTPTTASSASTITYRGGAAGRKAFTVPEIVLLNQCMDEIGFAGADMWSKVVEKFNRGHHTEWPECSVNSLKKKFMEVTFLFNERYRLLMMKIDGQLKAKNGRHDHS
jgi:hypothetical protein